MWPPPLLLWLPLLILLTNTRSTKADILSFNCDYGPEFSEKMHSEKDLFLEHLDKVISKSDVNNLSSLIKNLALKTEEEYLKEIVSSLPTKEVITEFNENAFNEEHPKAIQNAYQSLFNNIMKQMSNTSSLLEYELNKIKEEISNLTNQNDTKITEKLEALPTHESMKKLSNELSDIMSKVDLQNTEKQVIKLSQTLKESLTMDSLNLSNLLAQEDSNRLISTFTPIVSHQDIENIYTEVDLLSSKEAVNELFEKMTGLPKKEDLESMGIFIDDAPLLLKNDVMKIMEKLEGFANKSSVKILENSVNALEVEVDAYLDELNDAIAIAILLLEDLEAQDELINTLELHFNKLSSLESLMGVKDLLMTTSLSTNATLEYVEGLGVNSPSRPLDMTNSANDCVQLQEIEDSMNQVHDKIVSVCNNLKLQDLLSSYESKILNKIENLSLTAGTKEDLQEPPIVRSSSKAKRILDTSPCLDSEFVGAPAEVNTCSAIVARNLCSTDPLMSYHCCRSCVRAGQIQEMGPHRYLQVPRIINYNAVIWEMTLNKN